jgi:hypothetical protein
MLRRLQSMLVIATALVLVGPPGAQARPMKLEGRLHATSADTNAEGKFEESVAGGPWTGSGGMSGELEVKVRHLAPHGTFGVQVGGTTIGTVTTTRNGMGRARFRAAPLGRDQVLSIDPRGRAIAVTDATGDDVLTGQVSDPTTPGGTQCCLATADEQGCAVLLDATCTAAGGVDRGVGICDPDPCPAEAGDEGELEDDD